MAFYEPLTDLMEAVKSGNPESVRYELNQVVNDKTLLEKEISHSGHTALFVAITHAAEHVHGVEIVRILIQEGGMNVNHQSKRNNWTPVMLAAHYNLQNVIIMIWKAAKTTDVLRAESVDGENCLHIAAAAGDQYIRTAQTIITIAKDLKKVKNNKGQTPLDLAVERSNKGMVELLSPAGFLTVAGPIEDFLDTMILPYVKIAIEYVNERFPIVTHVIKKSMLKMGEHCSSATLLFVDFVLVSLVLGGLYFYNFVYQQH